MSIITTRDGVDLIDIRQPKGGCSCARISVANLLKLRDVQVENAITVTAKTKGTDGNLIAKAENSANLDWDGTGAYFTGGVDGTLGFEGEFVKDTANSKLWIALDNNTHSDANWKYISLT